MLYFNRVPLEAEALHPLQEIIEKADDTILYPECNFGNIMYLAENQLTELYLKSTPLNQLIIARIMLKNQRIGTGTKILEFLKSFAKNNGFTSIVIESTLTSAINHFALKHGFTPQYNLGFKGEDNEFYGNYKLEL